MAYYSKKKKKSEIFVCNWKTALQSKLEIIWKENGFTLVFAEILTPLEIKPILNLFSISDKIGFQSLDLTIFISSLIEMKNYCPNHQ